MRFTVMTDARKLIDGSVFELQTIKLMVDTLDGAKVCIARRTSRIEAVRRQCEP
jgi:hypothetical protein